MTNKTWSCAARGTSLASLLGTASLLVIAGTLGAQAQQNAQGQLAQAAVPEQVLVTGSLISGTPAVGAPVTTLSDQDFKDVGAITASDLLKYIPSVVVQGSLTVTENGGAIEGHQAVTIHGIGGTAPRSLLLVDGVRYPIQGHGSCLIDPSIIPELAVDHIDVLADGASATYGSDAVAGVINVTLKRGFDGAITQLRYGDSPGIGAGNYQASQLYGTKWSSGDITVTYETYGLFHARGTATKYDTYDFTPWGLDNRTPLISAAPGIVSIGDAAKPKGTPSGFSATVGTTCSNCYSIPKGQNGIGLTWAQILASPGVANEYNPYKDAWAVPDVQRNAATLTFDQNITNGIGLYIDGFYNNRRNNIHSAGTTGASDSNAFGNVLVPTSNPFYPIGAPPGLEVNYNLSREDQGFAESGTVGGRFEAGLNFEDLPFGWTGKLYYSKSQDQEFANTNNYVNQNMVSAALGDTVAAVPGSGVLAGQASFTKPANIPYLNLFCDSSAFTCNSPVTLAYINGYRHTFERASLDEAGTIFQGTVFDLPAGPLKAAIGGTYTTNDYFFQDHSNNGTDNTGIINMADDSGRFSFYAAFAQLNVPVISATNALPLVQQLNLELSYRFDHYTTVGSTTNPKIGVNWTLGEGFTIRGTWGTSFRAPQFVELSAVAGATIDPVNALGGGGQDNQPTCSVVGVPAVKGTAAAVLNPTCSGAENLLFPGGIAIGGGSGVAAPIRSTSLTPEKAINEAIGFNFAPTDFLRGLNVDVTVYHLRINNVLQAYSAGTSTTPLNDPLAAPRYILYTDPNFAKYVSAIIKEPTALPNIIASNIMYIDDGALRNVGWTLREGIDFTGQYDWDMGDWGLWNVGGTGNYALQNQSLNVPGTPIIDAFKGVNSGGRLNYHTHLGWIEGNNGAWSVTGIMNYKAHTGNTGTLPPSCFLIGNPLCDSSGLPEFAQYTQQYRVLTNYEPARITFDISIGYKTGDRPANDYLKNLAFQFTVVDLTDRPPEFAYIISTHGGSPRAFNQTEDPLQRTLSLVVTKAW